MTLCSESFINSTLSISLNVFFVKSKHRECCGYMGIINTHSFESYIPIDALLGIIGSNPVLQDKCKELAQFDKKFDFISFSDSLYSSVNQIINNHPEAKDLRHINVFTDESATLLSTVKFINTEDISLFMLRYLAEVRHQYTDLSEEIEMIYMRYVEFITLISSLKGIYEFKTHESWAKYNGFDQNSFPVLLNQIRHATVMFYLAETNNQLHSGIISRLVNDNIYPVISSITEEELNAAHIIRLRKRTHGSKSKVEVRIIRNKIAKVKYGRGIITIDVDELVKHNEVMNVIIYRILKFVHNAESLEYVKLNKYSYGDMHAR